MLTKKPLAQAATVVDLRFVSDVYWIPPQADDLIRVPPGIYAAPAIPRMEVFSSAVFEKTGAAPMGEFFFLVDKEKNRTLFVCSLMDEYSKPMWVEAST